MSSPYITLRQARTLTDEDIASALRRAEIEARESIQATQRSLADLRRFDWQEALARLHQLPTQAITLEELWQQLSCGSR